MKKHVIRKTDARPDYIKSNIWLVATRWIENVYLCLLLCVYPFIIKPGYGVTSYTKYNFMTGISYGLRLGVIYVPGFVQIGGVLVIIGTIKYIVDTGHDLKGFIKSIKLSPLDIMVLLYTLSLVISSAVSPYKDELIWGYPTWNMGLASQFLFVIIYFMISRFFDLFDLELLVHAAMLTSAVVFIIGILQRFGVDVFNLYQGMKKTRGYLSTIGQTSWFSSYMIIFVILSVFIVWYFDKSNIMYKAGVAHLIISSVCLVVQNTDSAFAGLFIALSFFFVWSFDSVERMMAFLETSLIILLSWRVTGVAQIIAGDKAVKLGKLSVFMSQSPLLWVLIGILVFAYLSIRLSAKKHPAFNMGRYRFFGWIYAGCVVAVIAGLAVYITLNTKKLLPGSWLSKNNYLLFNRKWGNKRGAILHDTILSLAAELKADPLRGIFGVGADQFYHVILDYVSKWTQKTNPKGVLTNAHNEWLTAFVNFGIFGGLTYIGIFVCSVIRNARHRRELPYVMAVAGCVAAYMAHNLFCYQQYICTPYIFVVLGLGEQITRAETAEKNF